MFGFDDSLKTLKRELKEAGADVTPIRDWQKNYDKVRKQTPVLEGQYQTARKELELVLAVLKQLEQYLIAGNVDRSGLENYMRELKKYQGHFNHEFLISKEDTDFQSTYDSILKLSNKGIHSQSEALILQSEVENLLAVTVEALDKEWPDFRAMAFFYIERTDRELFDLPHADKVAKVLRIYDNEFIKPMRDCMLEKLSEARVNQIMEDELWRY